MHSVSQGPYPPFLLPFRRALGDSLGPLWIPVSFHLNLPQSWYGLWDQYWWHLVSLSLPRLISQLPPLGLEWPGINPHAALPCIQLWTLDSVIDQYTGLERHLMDTRHRIRNVAAACRPSTQGELWRAVTTLTW